jgi:hypothetical protein
VNKSSFNFSSYVQEYHIVPLEIKGINDLLNSYLEVIIHFSFIQPYKEYNVDIDLLTAILVFNNTEISRTTEYVNMSLNKPNIGDLTKLSRNFRFRIGSIEMDFIEKHRNGDLSLGIQLIGIAQNIGRKDIASDNPSVSIPIKYGVSKEYIQSNIKIDIPQSFWVKTILNKLNYKCFQLIEIPLSHKNMKEAYENIYYEFEKANDFYKNQQYNECISACRKTMDKLKVNLYNCKNSLGSSSNYEWLKKINTASFTWIDEINKANVGITSIAHHTGDYEFQRYEAESIYLVTLGLMNFVGNIKN